MANREVEKVVLNNGTVVDGKESWNDTEKVPNQYFVGWNAGQAPHKSISEARAQAVVDKYPELIVGTHNGVDVIDTDELMAKIFEAADTALGIVVERVSTSRNTASKKLAEKNTQIESAIAEITAMNLPQSVKDSLLAKFK